MTSRRRTPAAVALALALLLLVPSLALALRPADVPSVSERTAAIAETLDRLALDAVVRASSPKLDVTDAGTAPGRPLGILVAALVALLTCLRHPRIRHDEAARGVVAPGDRLLPLRAPPRHTAR